MRFLTPEHSREWFASRSPWWNADSNPPASCIERIRMGADDITLRGARRLTQALLRWVRQHDPSECFLYVYEWGIWESSEDIALYSRWRAGLGDHLLLREANGHLSQHFEFADLESLGAMAISFGWGFDLAGCDGLRIVRVNHDGHVWAAATDEGQLRQGLDELRRDVQKA